MSSPTSPSWQARCLSVVISILAYRSRRASPDWFLKHMKSTWTSHKTKVVLSEDSRADYFEDTLENGHQTWQVFHIHPKRKTSASKRVILYWHGGGFHSRVSIWLILSSYRQPDSCVPVDPLFIWFNSMPANPDLQVPSLDSRAILSMALETGCPIIYPLYTLAPSGTAAQCIAGGLKLLLRIHRDERYRDHQIIITGASAGAWIALRLVLALSEIVLGKTTIRSNDSQDITERRVDNFLGLDVDKAVGLDIAQRISEVVLQSPWIDVDLRYPSDRCDESKVSGHAIIATS